MYQKKKITENMTEEKQQSNLSKSASHGSQNIEQLTYK